jgi:hypothetical protein
MSTALRAMLDKILATIGIDEHTALIILISVLVGAVLFSGRHHVRYHYGRFRNYYHRRYRRRYDDY